MYVVFVEYIFIKVNIKSSAGFINEVQKQITKKKVYGSLKSTVN